VGRHGQSQGKALAPHPGTVLDVCWTKVRSCNLFLIFSLRAVAPNITRGTVSHELPVFRAWLRSKFSIRRFTQPGAVPVFSSRSFVGYCLFPIIVLFFSPFTPHHMSFVISCIHCLNESSAIDCIPAGRSRITRRVSGLLGWDQACLGGN